MPVSDLAMHPAVVDPEMTAKPSHSSPEFRYTHSLQTLHSTPSYGPSSLTLKTDSQSTIGSFDPKKSMKPSTLRLFWIHLGYVQQRHSTRLTFAVLTGTTVGLL